MTVDGLEGRIAHLLQTKQSLARSLFESDVAEVRWHGAARPSNVLMLANDARAPVASQEM